MILSNKTKLSIGAIALLALPAIIQAQVSETAAPAVQAPAIAAPAAQAPERRTVAPQTGTGTGTAKPTASPGATTTTTVQTTTVKTTQKTTVVKKPGKKAKPAPPPKPAWEQFKLDPKTTLFLDFNDANPDMILSIFSRTSGITILKDPSFKSLLTVTSAKKVHLKDAFEILNTVLELNGYNLQKKGKLLLVGKIPVPAPPPPPPMQAPPAAPPSEESVVVVYPLTNANAAQVARVVNEVFTPQQLEGIMQQLQNGGGFNPAQQFGGRPGGGPQKIVRASSDEYSNKVVVNAPPKFQTDVAKLIAELDKSTETPLESEVFHLNYVGVDDAVDAVKDFLNSNTPTGRGAGKPQDQNQNPFGFFRFGGNNEQSKSGSQSVVAVKQTNSILVSATKENMELVRKLLKTLDVKSEFVGTTFVIHLENAKASDVAVLLNQAFTKPKDSGQSDNPFFFIFGGDDSSQKKGPTTDYDENGKLVNVRDLTGKVNVIADPNTNSLIVVTLPSNLKLVQRIVDKIDMIAEQVMIETVIVEANLDKTTKLGAEWSFLSGSANQNNLAGTTNFGIQSATTAPQGAQFTLTGSGYKLFLNAIQTDTRFKVLDTPRIFTSNNVKAVIDVSQKVPYITSQQTGVTTVGGLISNYDFLPVGVILTVTPRVTSSGEVTMDVIQSADDLQGFTDYNAPIVNHRQATTTVSVKDGETIILGGIIRHTQNTTNSKIPILGDIPIIGNLFRSTSHENGQTELMVLLTPHIVKSPAEAQRLREQETKKLSKESQNNIEKALRP